MMTRNERIELAARLIYFRKSRGLSLRGAARLAGVSHTSYAKAESSIDEGMDEHILRRLQRVLTVPALPVVWYPCGGERTRKGEPHAYQDSSRRYLLLTRQPVLTGQRKEV